MNSTDKQWEKWAKQDPYFAVITNEKFRSNLLDDEGKKDFFDSGEKDVGFVLETCRSQVDARFNPVRVLDFGCGVGRLAFAFAKQAEQVTGLDVADSMLKEARLNQRRFKIDNVVFENSTTEFDWENSEKFDLIHSFIVFQHIPPKTGGSIFDRLLSLLRDDGICAVQVLYGKQRFHSNYGKPTLVDQMKKWASNLFSYVVRSPDPEMQMNIYDLNQLMFRIQKLEVAKVNLHFTNHGGELGAYIFFQK